MQKKYVRQQAAASKIRKSDLVIQKIMTRVFLVPAQDRNLPRKLCKST